MNDVVMIAVDPHKASNTAAVLDPVTKAVAESARFASTTDGYAQLVEFAARWAQRRRAVEGCHGAGRSLAQRLVADGENVLDVPAKLAARVRACSHGHDRKTDKDDAVSIGLAALDGTGVLPVVSDDALVSLRLLCDRREELTAQGTQAARRLLAELTPGGMRRELSANQARPCSARSGPPMTSPASGCRSHGITWPARQAARGRPVRRRASARLGGPRQRAGLVARRAGNGPADARHGDHPCRRQERSSQHRDSRTVPAPPPLTAILRAHIREFGTAPDGRLFTGVRGGELPTNTYRRAWTKARQDALTPGEHASPLARRPYDLRHACLSTWLNSGVAPTRVAEWAGHSVDVVLRIYATCLTGQRDLAEGRIAQALREGTISHDTPASQEPPAPARMPEPR